MEDIFLEAASSARYRPLTSAEIYRRAHERGEIDLGCIPPIVLSCPSSPPRAATPSSGDPALVA
jgi:hypothetical protein